MSDTITYSCECTVMSRPFPLAKPIRGSEKQPRALFRRPTNKTSPLNRLIPLLPTSYSLGSGFHLDPSYFHLLLTFADSLLSYPSRPPTQGLLKENAARGLYTTIVGVGLVQIKVQIKIFNSITLIYRTSTRS